MEYKKQAHAVYYAQYHIVISTKYRRKVLKAGMGDYLKRKVLQVSKFQPEIEIIAVNTDIDHIHLLVSIPPKFSVSEVVKMIKAHTGTAMRRKFPFLDKDVSLSCVFQRRILANSNKGLDLRVKIAYSF